VTWLLVAGIAVVFPLSPMIGRNSGGGPSFDLGGADLAATLLRRPAA